ncbi:hypothetical protein EUA04_11675 [Mycolicibacterium obuense]|uniref:Uncharacterized protein n=1 Tax=Mycolicibacterium obuense TaxID=1807 RepID=A0A4R5X9T2_9MYCO|nr:hypothetical protein [Mycolicibacterium obuense]TDL10535.1 hypothetical protein EUA04_11675 [Mycolicibacterium obuense]
MSLFPAKRPDGLNDLFARLFVVQQPGFTQDVPRLDNEVVTWTSAVCAPQHLNRRKPDSINKQAPAKFFE